MSQITTLIRNFLPQSLLKSIRPVYNWFRSRVRTFRRARMEKLSLNHLISDLRAADIVEGDIVMVHSAMSRVGNIDGGAETIINSFVRAVEPSGTVMMPAYGSADDVLVSMKTDEYIDLQTQKSYMGKITEVFRTYPGVVRSSHPFSSICALGQDVKIMLSDHPNNPNVCHASSPMGRIVEHDAKIIGIGVTIAVGMAVSHFLEDTDETFPIAVHTPAFEAKYIDANGESVTRDVIRFDPKASITRIGSPNTEWINDSLTRHFTKLGIMKHFQYGNADSWVMNARPVFVELKRLAEKGITIYLTKDQWLEMNDGDASIDSW